MDVISGLTLAAPAGVNACIPLLAEEVVADKVPAVDHASDVIQTVVRPAACSRCRRRGRAR